jgi:hypothetical protein
MMTIQTTNAVKVIINMHTVITGWLIYLLTYLLTYLISSSYTLRCRGCFFILIIFTDSRTPWTSDQLIARPLPKHRTTQTQNKHIHIPNIHALCGIQTQDPSFQASEDSTCLRPLGYRDR